MLFPRCPKPACQRLQRRRKALGVLLSWQSRFIHLLIPPGPAWDGETTDSAWTLQDRLDPMIAGRPKHSASSCTPGDRIAALEHRVAVQEQVIQALQAQGVLKATIQKFGRMAYALCRMMLYASLGFSSKHGIQNIHCGTAYRTG